MFNVTLKRIRHLSPSTDDFRFVRDDGDAVKYEPGQFFRFTFEDEDGEFERSYSLCNVSDENGVLDLVISKVENGRATRLLFAAEEGFGASATGPYGRLVLPDPLPARLFLVATSVGIAPFMPMLRSLEKALDEGEVEVHFYFGARDPGEFLYESFLVDYQERFSGFSLTMCYSRAMPKNPRDFEVSGYVQDHLFELALDPALDHLLLCGNPKMIDDVYPRLKQLGFGPRRVTREKYVFARESGATLKKQMTEAQKKLLAEKMAKYSKGSGSS
jgi:ferredoxin-NADP reductase